MNEISIIINGVRYDAVENPIPSRQCDFCDCVDVCHLLDECPISFEYIFKKSDKKFER